MNYRIIILTTLVVLLLGVASQLAPPARADEGGISSLTLVADRTDYVGVCPREIHLTAKIQAQVPLGLVNYQFVHSDGSPTYLSQLNINRSGQFVVEETLRKTASWSDTVFLRVYVPVSGRAPVLRDSDRIMIKGECQFAQAVTRSESISLGPATGRFRVTFNGFTCNSQTLDNALNIDGADDEVFAFTKSFLVEKRADGSGVNASGPWRTRTPTIGDTSSGRFTDRLQGGSSRYLGSNGGFRSGDSFPTNPEGHSANPQAYALPQLIWEGELTRRQNAIVVIPMIWEWDGLPGLFNAWESAGLDQFYDVGRLISDPNLTDQDSAKVALRGEVRGQVWMNGRGLGPPPEDRPVGMLPYGDRDYRFRPEVLILTYDEAVRMAESQRNSGKAFPVVYADAPQLGGNYTLFIQVEQMP